MADALQNTRSAVKDFCKFLQVSLNRLILSVPDVFCPSRFLPDLRVTRSSGCSRQSCQFEFLHAIELASIIFADGSTQFCTDYLHSGPASFHTNSTIQSVPFPHFLVLFFAWRPPNHEITLSLLREQFGIDLHLPAEAERSMWTQYTTPHHGNKEKICVFSNFVVLGRIFFHYFHQH